LQRLKREIGCTFPIFTKDYSTLNRVSYTLKTKTRKNLHYKNQENIFFYYSLCAPLYLIMIFPLLKFNSIGVFFSWPRRITKLVGPKKSFLEGFFPRYVIQIQYEDMIAQWLSVHNLEGGEHHCGFYVLGVIHENNLIIWTLFVEIFCKTYINSLKWITTTLTI